MKLHETFSSHVQTRHKTFRQLKGWAAGNPYGERQGRLVVQDAESYQKLLEAQDRMAAIEGIKRGLESMKRNAGKPAEKFFQEFFAEKGISEHE